MSVPTTTQSSQGLRQIVASRYPLLIGVGSLIAFLIWHLPFLMWLAGAAVIIQLLVTFRRHSQSSAVQGTLSPDLQRKNRAQQLKRGLSKSQFETATEKPAGQALEQLQQVSERMSSFERTLSLKLDPGELTYGRYFGAAEQVCLGIFDQLNDVATRLANIVSIKDGANAEDNTRAELRNQESVKVNELLTLNERALTKLDQLTQAISEMKTQTHSAASDLEPLLLELEDLAQRAKKY